ncbi:YqhV family protein [Fodinisporobacter ferrooxydans]|uniref:YqhV family protein n=1 Tax=Fodinisporobacter ferrooxydans TaxID=2901836 RepID=A0ABY4CJD7_9BACL|nr:YqhV family protein [Alicyclobacillaceae bacterium MYW30-H2]
MFRDYILTGMVGLRLLSGTIEICAALLMWYLGTVEKAFTVNAFLSLVGPLVLVSVTALGLTGMADSISIWKIFIILCGVGLILYGVHS